VVVADRDGRRAIQAERHRRCDTPALAVDIVATGLIGVVPEQRGNGYAYDLLVECTHVLAEEGVDHILAATDFGNLPMAANFKKAGYPVEHVRINMT
jgi:GNAT superfamily N-acetyltransferase